MSTASGASTGAPAGVGATVMAALAWVPRLLLAQLAWLGLALLGGVVLGAAPATVVVLRMWERQQQGLPQGGPRELLRAFRRELVPANLAVGPFWLTAGAAGLNTLAVVTGQAPTWFVPYGAAAAILLGGLGLITGHHAAALRALMPAAPLPTLWRGGLTGPFVLPLATAAWMITVTALLAVVVVVPVVGLVLGCGAIIAISWMLLVGVWREKLKAADQGTSP